MARDGWLAGSRKKGDGERSVKEEEEEEAKSGIGQIRGKVTKRMTEMQPAASVRPRVTVPTATAAAGVTSAWMTGKLVPL